MSNGDLTGTPSLDATELRMKFLGAGQLLCDIYLQYYLNVDEPDPEITDRMEAFVEDFNTVATYHKIIPRGGAFSLVDKP